MKAESFCYWLMGLFEIGDAAGASIDHLTEAQVNIIQNHINLVKAHDFDNPVTEGHHFISWLEGLLASPNMKGVRDDDLPLIRTRLGEIFAHVIDPSVEPDEQLRDALQSIHDGETAGELVTPTRSWPRGGFSPRSRSGIRYMC